MKKHFSQQSLIELGKLQERDFALIKKCRGDHNKLGFAYQLIYIKLLNICTHRLDEAERLCDRFGLLHRGRMQQTGTLHQLQQQSGHEHLVDMFVDLLRS